MYLFPSSTLLYPLHFVTYFSAPGSDIAGNTIFNIRLSEKLKLNFPPQKCISRRETQSLLSMTSETCTLFCRLSYVQYIDFIPPLSKTRIVFNFTFLCTLRNFCECWYCPLLTRLLIQTITFITHFFFAPKLVKNAKSKTRTINGIG